ncbi:MAG: hypothetical protein Q4B45_06405 [Coriobacteriia bacterium]|nr:hypothetical protein [Coriobacteriia bacterium]
MILLKINDRNQGLYRKGADWAPIAGIEPDDLVALIEAVAECDEAIEMDECNADNPIKNPVDKTIYEEVYRVLRDLADNRNAYLAECQSKLDELEKAYGLEEIPSLENWEH